MKCPNCDGPLVGGETYSKKSASDTAVFGAGWCDLWMKTDDTGEQMLLLLSSEKNAAQFCRECGVAVIATEKGRRSAARKLVPEAEAGL